MEIMKLPNGYGGIVKMPGKRRKPWAVRVSYYQEVPGQPPKRKQKYIAFFSEQKHALEYLAEYNSGAVVKEHQKYVDIPTFAELYEKWKAYRNSLKNAPGQSAWKNYDIAFNFYAAVHARKIISIRANDLQDCITAQGAKSRSTIGNMRAIVRGMWKYALMNDYVEKDITQHLVFESSYTGEPIHTRYTDKEIKSLWEALGSINNVDIILIYIYTGMRPSELLEMLSENVHLDKRYMVGGMKTEAGRNRYIPIHEAIVPLIKYRLEQNRKYLITNKYGNQYTRAVYQVSNFNTVMQRMNMNHVPHDGRYTFASLADSVGMNEICRKIIMGHAIPNKDNTAFKTGGTSDVTEDVYTEKTMAQLLAEVNKLPIIFPDVK
jgi:integrase